MTNSSPHKAIRRLLDRVRAERSILGSQFGAGLAALIFLRWADAELEAAVDGAMRNHVLPAKYDWRLWCNLRDPKALKQVFRELPSALRSFTDSRDDATATRLRCVAAGLDHLSLLTGAVLVEVVDWFADQPFETPKDRRVVRDVLDGVLTSTRDKSLAQFFTPVQVTALMVELAQPKSGESIYDPCCGSAGLLTGALEFLDRDQLPSAAAEPASRSHGVHLAGIESDQSAFVIGLTRLVLSGVDASRIEFGNSLALTELKGPDGDGVDIVLANPPWGVDVAPQESELYPFPSKESTSLFLQHMISQLRPGGRGVMVVPPGLLFRGGRERDLREWLVREHTVETIVSIPRGAFAPYTSIETCLLLFRRGGSTRSVRMVNPESVLGSTRSERADVAPFAMAARIAHDVRATVPGPEAWDVDAEDLAAIGFDLTPTRRDRSSLERIIASLRDEAEVRCLEDCCTLTSGRSIRSSDLTGSRPKSNYEPSGQTLFSDVERSQINPQRPFDFADTPIPYIRIKDVAKGQATGGTSWLMPAVASTIESKWQLRADDILLSKSGRIGKAGIVRNDAVGAIAAHGFFIIRVTDPTLDPHYLLQYLQSAEVVAWMEDQASGSTARHLSSGRLKRLPVVVPASNVQSRVAEQCRAFNVDAVSYLAELVGGDDITPLASDLNAWVMRSLRIARNAEFDARDPSTGDALELLEAVAGEQSPVNRCQQCGQPYYRDVHDAHCGPPHDWSSGQHSTCLACWLDVGPGGETIDSMSDECSLTRWALAFTDAMSPLSRIGRIPTAVGALSILQPARAKLSAALDCLSGHLPNTDRARDLTGTMLRLIDGYSDRIAEDIRIDISVESALEHDEIASLELVVCNEGALPLRDVGIESASWLHALNDIEYADAGTCHAVHLQGELPEGQNTPLELTIRWSATTLSGDRSSGEVDVLVELESLDRDHETSRPDLGSSPYVCGDPVRPQRDDVFKGRDELLDQIRRQVMQSGNVVLLEGNRRAGKSSVLLHLEGENAVPGWLGVYCSLQGMEGAQAGGVPTATVFRTIAVEVAKAVRKLNGAVVLPDGSVLDAGKKLGISRAVRVGISEDAPFDDLREYLEMVLETLAEQDLGLLLMLDEFDKLQEGIDSKVTSPQVPENIRFLVQSYPKFSAILTGSRRLKRMREQYWSALFGLGTRLGVSALPFDAASKLITEPVQGRLSFAQTAVRQAYSLTAGHAYLLQCLCNRVFDIAARTGVRSITVDHINDAADALVEDNEHFASLWDYVEFDRRRFLLFLLHREQSGPDVMRLRVLEAKLAAAGVDLREEVVMSDLEFLRELELVEMHGDSTGSHYTLTVPMMGRWLESQHDYDVLRSRARAEAEDIGTRDEITPSPDANSENSTDSK